MPVRFAGGLPDDEDSSWSSDGESSESPQDALPDWARPYDVTDQTSRHFKTKWFKTWRSIFRYDLNPESAEILELSFRAASVLMLCSIPKVFGMDKDENSPFYRLEIAAPMSLLAFVYTLSTSMGVTIGYAIQGVTGTVAAAMVSGVMYLIYPDDTGDQSGLSPPCIFGFIFGVLAIVIPLLFNVNTNFQIFYLSNFVWFWMEFMHPGSAPRTAEESAFDSKILRLFGLLTGTDIIIIDWGGGALWTCSTMSMGAFLAILTTLLPYPIMSLDKAKDSAANMVCVLGEAWYHVIEFHLEDDRDETIISGLHAAFKKLRSNFGEFDKNLQNAWWEEFLLGRCRKHRQYTFLMQFEVCLTRCIRRLEHAANVCDEEKFCDLHDEIVAENNCGRAIRTHVKETNLLLRMALRAAEDGLISEEEKEYMNMHMGIVTTAETELTHQALKIIGEIKARKISEKGDRENGEFHQTLIEEQALLFTLCDFSAAVHEYCEWLIKEHNEKNGCVDLTLWKCISDRGTILSAANLNFTLRYSLSITICWIIGFHGYSKMIARHNAGIASAVGVLLCRSTVTPIGSVLTRLQGVTLGIVFGRLTYAVFGWCSVPMEIVSSALEFAYVFVWEYVYLSGSSLGLIALAFGTKELVAGCSADVVDMSGQAHLITNVSIALLVMFAVDQTFALGRPSDLAYRTYRKAWDAWDTVLQEILTITEVDESMCHLDPQTDTVSYKGQPLLGLIEEAEAFAKEAIGEARIWRPPFPSHNFTDMIDLGREMRTAVICMSSVIFKKDAVGACRKKGWFKRAMAEDDVWIEKKENVLLQMATTYGEICNMLKHTGHFDESLGRITATTSGVSRRGTAELRQFSSLLRRASKDSSVGDGDLADSKDAVCDSLLQHEGAQQMFVFFCIDRIHNVNRKLHLQLRRNR